MVNAPKYWSIEQEYKDVESQNYWTEAVRVSEQGIDPTRKERIAHGLQLMARDHSRLPFQWNSSVNGGFSTGTPWMRAHDLYEEINAEAQGKDSDSVLSFYKRILHLRKEHKDVFVYGAFELLEPENPHTFVYRKTYQQRAALVMANFTAFAKPLPRTNETMKLLVSSWSQTIPDKLQPFEARIYIDY